MLHIYKKRGASPVTRSTVERPSHCPDCRNEQRRKPHADAYIELPHYHTHYDNASVILYYTLGGRSRCFVFDNQMSLRSSSTVKTKASSNALCIYALSLHVTYDMRLQREDSAKI